MTPATKFCCKNFAFLTFVLAVRSCCSEAVSVVPLAITTNATTDLGSLSARVTSLASFASDDWKPEALSLLQVSVHSPSRVSSSVSQNQQAPRSSPRDALPLKQRVVWIKAFPRSGSSLMFALVAQVNFPVFALFEPCSQRDNLEPWLAKKGCGALLSQLAKCNFTGVNSLQHWWNPKTLRNEAGNYSPKRARRACKAAGLVAMKTVTWGHDLKSEMIPFLEANPQVQAIDLVRDPRSIYRSMTMTVGFLGTPEKWLFEMCDYMSKGLHVSHPRLLRVIFEDFVKRPVDTSSSIFSFMSIPRELEHFNAFLGTHVNSDWCPEGQGKFTDCRSNSSETLERSSKLPLELQTRVSDEKACRAVINFYKYKP